MSHGLAKEKYLVNELKKVLVAGECNLEDEEINKVVCVGQDFEMLNRRNVKQEDGEEHKET